MDSISYRLVCPNSLQRPQTKTHFAPHPSKKTMHPAAIMFVQLCKKHFPHHFANSRVLEVGSADINGSIVSLFSNCDYIGCDISNGPGVSLVCRGEDLEFPSNLFSLCISCECFEHNPAYIQTFVNMVRMVKPGGLIIFTSAGLGRPEHGTSRTAPHASLTSRANLPDYYKNLDSTSFPAEIMNQFRDYAFFKNPYSRDLYFIGVKSSGVKGHVEDKVGTLSLYDKLKSGVNELLLLDKLSYQHATRTPWRIKNSILEILFSLFGDSWIHDLKYKLGRNEKQRSAKTMESQKNR